MINCCHLSHTLNLTLSLINDIVCTQGRLIVGLNIIFELNLWSCEYNNNVLTLQIRANLGIRKRGGIGSCLHSLIGEPGCQLPALKCYQKFCEVATMINGV